MVDQIAERYGTVPDAWLADGGFVSLATVTDLDGRGIALYAPPPERQGGRPPGPRPGPRPGDAPPVLARRARMASEDDQPIDKERAATSEWVDTQTRGRGFQQMPVRGLVEAKAIALWHAIGHNLTHLIAPLAARPA
mgnify:CR=1 FL=1